MKKIVILPLLLLSVPAGFGMNIPKPDFSGSHPAIHAPNPTLRNLQAQLDDLKDKSSLVLIGQEEASEFCEACDNLRDAALAARYQILAHDAMLIKNKTMAAAARHFKKSEVARRLF